MSPQPLASPNEVEPAPSVAGPVIRYRVIGLGFLAAVICYLDRTNISVAIIPMAEQFGWSKTTMGLVLSSFFFGYLATQVLGGWLADRFGGKLVLAAGVVIWSLFTVLTAPAAYFGIFVLVAARIGMGLGEGVTFPAIYSLFARWTPPQERTRSISLALSGIPIGSVAALLLTPPIIVAFGWEAAFYVFGALGLLWWAAWHFLVTSTPEEHPRISPAELDLIRGASASVETRPKPPWRAMLSHPAVWAIIVSHFCANWGTYVFLAWLPTYVNQALGVDLAAVGLFAVAPSLLSAVGLNCAGWVGDSLLRRGLSVTTVRKTMNSVGFGVNAAILFSLGLVSSAALAIALMCIATFFGAMAVGGFGTNHLDIAPRHAGTLMGISNTVATIPGIVGVAVSGMILDATGSWGMVFGVAGAIAAVGMTVFAIFASGEKIFD